MIPSKESLTIVQSLMAIQQELQRLNSKIDSFENRLLGNDGMLRLIQSQLVQSTASNVANVTDNMVSLCNQLTNYFGGQNLQKFLTYQAGIDTARFIIDNMLTVPSFDNKGSLLDAALERACNTSRNGLFLEFGVFQGSTINYIAERIKETVIYGFDSFHGLPETWRTGFEKGTFKMDELPVVRDNVVLVQGYFDKSLPKFLKQHDESCTFIHIDCDLYSSTKTIFDLLADRIVENTVIAFDEFFNYPGWKEGECKAFAEFLEKRQMNFEYVGYTQHEQVAVQLHEA